MNFGRTLKTFLFLSNAKMKDIAEVLSYDPSYISKWIAGTHLPNRKSIELLLTKASHFFAENIIASGKEIHYPTYFSGTDVPEIIHNYQDLQVFIFNYLMSAYNQTDKAMNPGNEFESNIFASKNCYASYNLDEIMLTVHGVCENGINKFPVLNIIASINLEDLEDILESQIKPYCMMFRSSNVRLSYYMKKTDAPLQSINKLWELSNALKQVNPNSTVRLFYAPDNMKEFIFVQGCYLIYKYDVLGKSLYFMMNDQKNIEFYGDQILHYPYNRPELISTELKKLSLGAEGFAKYLQHDEFFINFTNLSLLVGFSFIKDFEDLSLDTVRLIKAFNLLVETKRVHIIFSKEQATAFLKQLEFPPVLGGRKISTQEAKEMMKAIYDFVKNNDKISIHILGQKEIDQHGLNYDFVLTESQLAYFPIPVAEMIDQLHYMDSRVPEFNSQIKDYLLEDALIERPTGTNLEDLFKYVNNYLNLIDQI